MELAYQCCPPVACEQCAEGAKSQRPPATPPHEREMSISSFLRWATGNDNVDFEHPLLK